MAGSAAALAEALALAAALADALASALADALADAEALAEADADELPLEHPASIAPPATAAAAAPPKMNERLETLDSRIDMFSPSIGAPNPSLDAYAENYITESYTRL